MAKKKAETPAEQPEKTISTAVSEEQTAVPSSPEATATGSPEEQAAVSSGTDAAAKAPEDTEEGQASTEEKNGADDEPQGRPAVVCAEIGLNLRMGPALTYKVLDILSNGAEVTALELPMGAEVPGWRLVSAGERIGWVQSRFLRLER